MAKSIKIHTAWKYSIKAVFLFSKIYAEGHINEIHKEESITTAK
jgi:hypothetical protein